MSSSPSDFGQLVKTTTQIKYSSLAAATFFFWDYCITFGDECLQCVEMLLVLRLYAFYGRPKGLLIALCVLFFAINGAAVVIMVILLSQFVLKPIPSSVPSKFRNVACFVVNVPTEFPYYWTLGLAYDSILFFLLIGMWIHKYFATGMSGGGLLQVLVRDGAWAFFTVFDSFGGVGIMAQLWLHTCLGVVGPRLVLNLRDFDRKRRSLMSEECELHTINDRSTLYASSSSHAGTQQEQSTSFEGIKKGHNMLV
ncbi:hypothetical protein BU17DRAFT_69253 [Hysterangium stoloniferum]|nr:hypothetical protein BU17DRAFT_69253 [Hysterangium stoloniferum]